MTFYQSIGEREDESPRLGFGRVLLCSELYNETITQFAITKLHGSQWNNHSLTLLLSAHHVLQFSSLTIVWKMTTHLNTG